MTEEERARSLDALQERLGHRFADPELLDRALTHSSFAHESGGPSNERLEFLGDAVLEAAIARALFERLPDADEGQLSHHKHGLVSGEVLAGIGRELGLPLLLKVGEGARRNAVNQNPAKIEDATEALLGAIFLDGGFGAVCAVIERCYAPRLATLRALRAKDDAAKNIVTRLREACARKPVRAEVVAVVLARSGPAHEPRFEVGWWCGGELLASDWGSRKKLAERNAAGRALDRLRALVDAGWLPDRAAIPPRSIDEPDEEAVSTAIDAGVDATPQAAEAADGSHRTLPGRIDRGATDPLRPDTGAADDEAAPGHPETTGPSVVGRGAEAPRHPDADADDDEAPAAPPGPSVVGRGAEAPRHADADAADDEAAAAPPGPPVVHRRAKHPRRPPADAPSDGGAAPPRHRRAATLLDDEGGA